VCGSARDLSCTVFSACRRCGRALAPRSPRLGGRYGLPGLLVLGAGKQERRERGGRPYFACNAGRCL